MDATSLNVSVQRCCQHSAAIADETYNQFFALISSDIYSPCSRIKDDPLPLIFPLTVFSLYDFDINVPRLSYATGNFTKICL